MTQTNDTCRGGRPSGVRRPGAGRIARTPRMRVSSDAVVSAYIRDIARPHAGGNQRDPTPPSSRHRRAWLRHPATVARADSLAFPSERRIPSNDPAGGDDAECKNHSER